MSLSTTLSLIPTSKYFPLYLPPKSFSIFCAKKSQRTGKLRYPSEKKRLRLKQEPQLDVSTKFQGFWRLFQLGVGVERDPGKDFLGVSQDLLEEIAKVFEFPGFLSKKYGFPPAANNCSVRMFYTATRSKRYCAMIITPFRSILFPPGKLWVASMLPPEAFTVVRKSFDARKSLKEPKFVYVVDVDVDKLINLEPRTWDFISELKPKVGLIEHMPHGKESDNIISIARDYGFDSSADSSGDKHFPPKALAITKPKVAVVGSGPSGLFASLVLAELGADVTLIERGQAVEQRGRDIGALVVRKILQLESNFCFGEGGAGTWSDGKLVTRIGRNSDGVLAVMKTLVYFGAPENILVDGKPHLGTDRLVPLLRNFRHHLQGLGVNIMFGTRLDDLLVDNRTVVGLNISDSKSNVKNIEKIGCDAVILAVGHSARDIYEMLLSHDLNLIPKDFAVGLRVEHPQELINSIQYSGLATEVRSGRGRVPVADYKVVKYINGNNTDANSNLESVRRSCYSFCMCPGGQVVLTSTNAEELCINGMSFSRRSSKWANAALVVNVSSKDFESLNLHGPLAGVEFQREFERRAAIMGGGNFVLPVQTVTDFLDNRLSGSSLPPSSYRLGVKAAKLHELFPSSITDALQKSISKFDNELPGYISSNALLHGVETRTSSPIQIPRDSETYESTSLKGLYPIGEGAGYAGGIVSAAVDGMYAGFALAKKLGLYHGNVESILGKAQNAGLTNY